MHNIQLWNNKKKYSCSIPEGKSLLYAIQQAGISHFSAPCNGKGTCGKCRVKIIPTPGIDDTYTFNAGAVAISEADKRFLNELELASGIRLACSYFPLGATSAEVLQEHTGARVLAGNSLSSHTWVPRYQKFPLRFRELSLENQKSLSTRVMEVAGEQQKLSDGVPAARLSIAIDQLQLLSKIAAENSGDYELLISDTPSVQVVSKKSPLVGAAIDIGTTTIVVYLANLIDGRIIDVWSGLNAQRAFGADVISRIQYTAENESGGLTLKKVIISQIQEALSSLLHKNQLDAADVKELTIAANTTMLHLLLGVNPQGIAASPFIPVFTQSLHYSGATLGFSEFPQTLCTLLPSIAAYVGADISAGIEVVGLRKSTETALLLDLGTNGEMALSVDKKIFCCSTAAGPAFEGANIEFGTGGISGAVDSVRFVDDKLIFTTIDNAPAIGICGSGIIDLTAVLVEARLIDYTGRLVSPEETSYPWIIMYNDSPAIQLVTGEDSGIGNPILFTQKDLREVQLAKAAVAGGIKTLCSVAGIQPSEIVKLFLAGGFGSYIDPLKAQIMGLIPQEIAAGQIHAAGNTSGEGALRALCCKGDLASMEAIAENCTYIELSSRSDFQNFYIEEMYFPE